MVSTPRTVLEWSRHFHEIYCDANAGKQWWYFATKLATRICLLASPKYFDGPGNFDWQLSKGIAWLFGLHNQLAKPFSQSPQFGSLSKLSHLLLAEFPQRCPYCGKPNCDLLPSELHGSGHRLERRSMNQHAAVRLIAQSPNVLDFSLHSWGEMVLSIFPADRTRPLHELAGKVAEEFGELTKSLHAYRHDSNRALEAAYREEFADLLSRLCAFAVRHLMSRGEAGSHENLDEIVWNLYGAGCPSCGHLHPTVLRCSCDELELTEVELRQRDSASLYGPAEGVYPTIIVAPNIQVAATAGAHSHAASHAHASAHSMALTRLHELAQEDRIERPNLECLFQRLEEETNARSIAYERVKSTLHEIATAVPPARRGRYAAALRDFVIGIASGLSTGPLKDWMDQFAVFISNWL